jgi:putative ABC transport system permease protein
MYVPLAQAGDFDVEHFIVRTAGEPRMLIPAVAHELVAVDNGFSLDAPTTMDDVVDRVRAPWRFNMLLFSAFGGVSIGLTSIGIFGLIAYTVTWRRREIGVRIALGAQADQVTRMIVLQGAKLVGCGMVIGLGITLLTSRLVASLLFETGPQDPSTLVEVCATVLALTTLACYLPARRAALLDPSMVFRDE